MIVEPIAVEQEVAPPAAEPEEDLPIVESVGIVQTPRGWSVVYMQSQGNRIILKEIESGPDSRIVAAESVKRVVVRRLLQPRH